MHLREMQVLTGRGPRVPLIHLNLTHHPDLELLAGQHRKQALHKLIESTETMNEDDFPWIINCYDLTNMPAHIQIDLTANINTISKEQSTAEIFRDMFAVVGDLAQEDQGVLGPDNQGNPPSVDGYLRVSKYGAKSKIQTAFASKLTVCAQSRVRASLPKYVAVMATPTRQELVKFCNADAGMEISNINMAYEMSLLACYQVSNLNFLSSRVQTNLALVLD